MNGVGEVIQAMAASQCIGDGGNTRDDCYTEEKLKTTAIKPILCRC